MDFRFSPEEERFRQEICDFVCQELGSEWLVDAEYEYSLEAWPHTREIARKLGKRGWLAISWPKEYGGSGAPTSHHVIFYEEAMYWGIPGATMGAGGTPWVGPSLLLFGTEAQKREHVPPLAAGERFWCTGYSEPGAGSDLGSLQTRAWQDGDVFIINGQKVWTSGAHLFDWCWLAARTNPDVPKHQGISLFLVDMKSPGITVRPIIDMSGGQVLTEVYFDGVKVPRENLVGEVDRGWHCIMTAMGFERTWIAVGPASIARRILDELVRYVQEHGIVPENRWRLAELAIEVAVGRLLAHRVAFARGQVPDYQVSVAKVFGSELVQRASQLGMGLLGLWGLAPASLSGRLPRWIAVRYLGSPAETIGGGTTEIQRNIIAMRGLGLPR